MCVCVCLLASDVIHTYIHTKKQLFEGDARFGIDRTAKEYKETEGMKAILGEQAKRRRTTKEPASAYAASPAEPRWVVEEGKGKGVGGEGGTKGKSLASLAQKFKRK